MTQEALKLSQEALAGLKDVEKQVRELVAENRALKEALAQTELCKYGQEPKSCTSNPMDCQCAIDASLAQTQEPDVQETLHWHAFNYRQAHTAQAHEMWQKLEQFVDSKIKASQRTERPVDCERCNRLEEHAYDLIGKLRVANIKLSMQPQRTWVDLTDEDVMGLCRTFMGQFDKTKFIKATEDKIKELNT